MSERKILCPRCPLCRGRPAPPPLPCNIDQAFCNNPDCSAMTWEPGKSLDDNLTQVNFHDLTGWPLPD